MRLVRAMILDPSVVLGFMVSFMNLLLISAMTTMWNGSGAMSSSFAASLSSLSSVFAVSVTSLLPPLMAVCDRSSGMPA